GCSAGNFRRVGNQQERCVKCDRRGEDSRDEPALRDAGANRTRRVGRGGGTAAGRDGQFRSRASHHRCGPRDLPGFDAITKAIESGAFARNPTLADAIKKTVANGATLHIWGLLSDGSVHSHIDHLMALLDVAAAGGASRIAVHAVLDGRDKPPRSALKFIDQLEAKLKQLGRGRIATVTGRYYAMDRDKRWERIERAWRAIVEGDGLAAPIAREAVENSYAAGKSDEFVEPHVIGERSPMADGDQVICFNFRADRARELTAALALGAFSGFRRSRIPKVGY